jgi:predicted methyltransferase
MLVIGAVLAAAVDARSASSPSPSPPPPTPAPSGATPPTRPSPFRATSTHPFDDVAYWSSVFDDPKRDAWQKPDELLATIGVGRGMRVADLGAGTGYFERRLSAAVGERGTVYAVETEPNLVAHLRTRAEREQTPNVVPVLASFDEPRLPGRNIDLVLIIDTYHHLDHRRAYLEKLRRVLAPGGRIVVVDWKAEPLPVGPPLDHKLPRAAVVEEMTAAGFLLSGETDILPYQYVLVFQPRPPAPPSFPPRVPATPRVPR